MGKNASAGIWDWDWYPCISGLVPTGLWTGAQLGTGDRGAPTPAPKSPTIDEEGARSAQNDQLVIDDVHILLAAQRRRRL